MPSELLARRIFVRVWVACGVGLKSTWLADRHGQSTEAFHFKMLRDCRVPPVQDCHLERRCMIGRMSIGGSRSAG
ncbi:hypothetical protein RBSH_02822 [Rhodopirellula baltica SH28]|uniref:Uncharacterized protein n=1 Tax=Rhodopirellula baltica SH28 TaxID=993517 RepID=K5DGC6_RHOBT|nr:hypothetical protein RBSH_02822 [Rhodopirellula baltica SH28]